MKKKPIPKKNAEPSGRKKPEPIAQKIDSSPTSPKPEPKLILGGRFAVVELPVKESPDDPTLVRPGRDIELTPAGPLLEAKCRIENEARWRRLAYIMRKMQNLSRIVSPEGRPHILATPDERLSRELFHAVAYCAEDLPDALEKAARYLRDPRKPISKKGGLVTLKQPGQETPPVVFAVSVIEAACRAVAFRYLDRLNGRSKKPLEPTKGKVKKRWEEMGWELSDGGKWAASPRMWPEVFKEIGLDDLKQTPRKPSTEKKRNRKKQSR